MLLSGAKKMRLLEPTAQIWMKIDPYMQRQISQWLYTVSQKITSHFNFRHNFTIYWDIFTIFEAACYGLIAGWCNLLHTHHRCEAFTWRDVTHYVIQAVSCCAQCALTRDFIPPDLWCLNSTDLNPADYSFSSILQEKVYQTHIANIDELKHRLVQVSAELDRRHRCSYRTAATPSQCVWLVCESSMGISWPTFALNLHLALWAIC